MGLNVDLTQMLGLYETVKCPKCGNRTPGYFDDYDIECGHPNPSPGRWELSVCCKTCEHDFKVTFNVTIKRTDEPPRRQTFDIPPNSPCPSCGSTNKELVDGSVVYPHRPDLFHKAFWRCPDCEKSYVGCHPDTTVPLGTLADEETRKARGAAHAAFDRLWKKEEGGFMKRKEAYAWLAEVLGLDPKTSHISWFDTDTCNYAAELSRQRFELGPQT